MFRLEVRGLYKSFGNVPVLHGVDVDAVGGRVLALLGENGAGKSTTVKILAGDHRCDAGTISVSGRPVDIRSPRDAEAIGIRAIFQEFLDAPQLSVAENICLGRLPRRGWRVDWRAVRRTARTVLDQLGVDLPLDRPVEQLGVAQRQIVEIARALVADARLLILDEPTSALAAAEVENLFRFVRRLRDDGVAIIYITHRLDEVAEIADDVVVFRDGRVAAAGPVTEFDQHALVTAMVGQDIGASIDLPRHPPAHAALTVRDVHLAGHVDGVSLTAHAGEVLSLFGRLGCGALELAEAMFGLRRFDAGTMTVADSTGQPAGPWAAIRAGIGFLPVDRKTQGVLNGLSAAENIAAADWSRKARFGMLSPRASRAAFQRWQEELRIVAPKGAGQPIETLSGGNQQKIMLGRWLERGATVLLLAEPTRGVDVGARAEIYRILSDLAGRGVAIIVVSSDIDEVLRVSDRIVVFSRGRVSAELTRAEADRARLTRAAAMKETV
ncbi:sugar ABC transporter ATP-binding protein [Actinophytocola sp.]|uniref:sugar ABC transporter ATP-binding protein n=1 Tax=Actinophytocola sp. TaxID=1872138 RepID=UPI002ED6A4F8